MRNLIFWRDAVLLSVIEMSRHGNFREAIGREKESVCSKRNAVERKASP